MTEGAGLLEELVREVRRYVVMTSAQADLIALWIAHTHALDAAEVTPYLHVAGPERRVGKSRLLDVLALYVRNPIPTANVSEAAVFRLVGKASPTLLFDEVDAIFGPKARDHEDLRGLLNAGFQRGAMAWRCVGDGSKQSVESFPVFSCKAFASIGHVLPDTLADRSIRIDLKRKRRDEDVDRFRKRDATEQAAELRDAIASWAERNIDRLAQARPALPDELDDRAQDAWEPLLAFAEVAGDDWPARARQAALELFAGDESEESLGERLLADVHAAFETAGTDRLATAELIRLLAADEESPWHDWRGKGKISARAVARMLSNYGIRSGTVRVGEETAKGYKRKAFEDAWTRYASLNGRVAVTTSQPASVKGLSPVSIRHTTPLVTDTKSGSNPHEYSDVTDVTDRTPDQGDSAELEWLGTATLDELGQRYGAA